MSIPAPRYATAAYERVGRPGRALAVYAQELRHRGGWATGLVVGLTYALVLLVVMTNAEFASLTGGLALSTFESPFETVYWPFLILTAAIVGSGVIADDVAQRSLVLYRSRPIALFDYLAAKGSACGSWLVIAAVGPGVIGVSVLAALGVAPSPLAFEAIGAFAAVGLLAAVFFTGLALALSSLTAKRLYAGAGIFGLALALEIVASVVRAATANPYVGYLSPITDLHYVALAVFDAGASGANPAVAALVLCGGGIALALLSAGRVAGQETVGE